MIEKKDAPAAENAPEILNDNVQDLKAAREARGLTLRDVFLLTRVSLINLQAVETEDFHHLPPPVYARNFIRKYARAIGVDEKPLLARYERHLNSLTPLHAEAEVRKPWPEVGRHYRFLFLSLAAVIAAGVLVYAIFLYDQSRKNSPPEQSIEPPLAEQQKPTPAGEQMGVPQPKVDSASQEAVASAPASTAQNKIQPPAGTSTSTGMPKAAPPVSQEATTAVPTPTAQKKTQPPPTASAGKTYHLVIEARELTWVRITEDGNTPYQSLLKPGDKIERMASDYFILDVGNAGGINVTFQGKNMGSLGKQGQVLHVRLPEKTPEEKTP